MGDTKTNSVCMTAINGTLLSVKYSDVTCYTLTNAWDTLYLYNLYEMRVVVHHSIRVIEWIFFFVLNSAFCLYFNLYDSHKCLALLLLTNESKNVLMLFTVFFVTYWLKPSTETPMCQIKRERMRWNTTIFDWNCWLREIP